MDWCSDSFCEEGFILGAKGICNNVTGLCECPDGYSGNDDWKAYNDCRVNESLQKGMWVFSLFMSLLTLFVSILLLVIVGCDTKKLEERTQPVLFSNTSTHVPQSEKHMSSLVLTMAKATSMAEVESLQSTMEESELSETESLEGRPGLDTERIQKEKDASMQRRNCLRTFFTRFSMLLFLAFPLGALMYYIPFFKSEYRFENHFYQDMGLAFIATAIFTGLWSLFYAWYISLPGLRMYGRLLGAQNSILLQKPVLVQTSIFVRIFLIAIINVFLCYGYLYWIDDSPETRYMMDTVFIFFLCVLIADFSAWALLLARLGLKIFRKLDNLCDQAIQIGVCTPEEKRGCEEAIYTVSLIRNSVLVIAPVVFGMFLLTGVFDPLRGRTYLTVNVAIVLGNVANLIAFFVSAVRLRKRS